MLLFRSEEHIERWCGSKGVQRGATLTPQQTWELARVFYSRKLDPDWQRAPVGEIEATFARIGLTGDFWSLSS